MRTQKKRCDGHCCEGGLSRRKLLNQLRVSDVEGVGEFGRHHYVNKIHFFVFAGNQKRPPARNGSAP